MSKFSIEMVSEVLDKDAVAMLQELPGPDGGTMLDFQLDLFLETGPESSVLMSTALRAKDLTKLYREAHKFKSSCSIIGAVQLSNYCEEVEYAAKALDESKADAALVLLVNEYQKIIALLSK